MAEDAESPGEDINRRDWRERDLKRAIAVAQQAGLEAYRVEIAPDGTISVVVGGPPEDA